MEQPIAVGRPKISTANLLMAAALFTLYATLTIANLHRDGVTFDEPERRAFGDRYLRFYQAFDKNALDFSSLAWSPNQTWPVGPTLAALSAKLFSDQLRLVDQIGGHHLASIFLRESTVERFSHFWTSNLYWGYGGPRRGRHRRCSTFSSQLRCRCYYSASLGSLPRSAPGVRLDEDAA